MSTSRENSKAQSRTHRPRSSSVASIPYIPQVEALILPDGNVGEQAAELLQNLVHTHHHEPEDTLVSDETPEEEEEHVARARLPWWKRPSPYWLFVALPFTATSMGMTLAPRVEIYTVLACSKHRPEYAKHLKLSKQMGLPYDDSTGDFFSRPPLALGSPLPIDFSPAQDDTLSFESPIDSDNITVSANPDRCATDPEVQAAVAKLTLLMTLSQGIIACLTAVWWGSFSDRRGRKRVMSFSVVGLLFNDLSFLFVSRFSSKLPGGYWLLLVGPIADGLMGGMTSGVAAMHAYLSDTTDPAARSRTFSRFLGLLFTGIALGPTLGAIVIRLTGNVLSVFVAAAAMHLFYALLVWIVLPESLTKRQMSAARARHEEALKGLKDAQDAGVAVGLLMRMQRAFAFLSPLMLFVPARVESVNPLKAGTRNWNLTFVAVSYGLVMMIMGSYAYKFQYTLAKFAWSSEIIGYYLTVVGVTRALYLMVVLPVIIKLLKPKAAIALPADEGEDSATSVAKPEYHSPQFDLNLARFAVLLDVVSYSLMGFANSGLLFTVFTLLSSLGAGFSPAVQSVALELYSRRGETETGKLFGALSVANALGSQIIGPALFGFTYIRTVAFFPSAIFHVSSLFCTIAFILLCFVSLSDRRLQGAVDVEEQATGMAREETLVNAQPEVPTSGSKTATSANLVDV